MRSVKQYRKPVLPPSFAEPQSGRARLIDASEVLAKNGAGMSNRNVKNLERERALRRSQIILAAKKVGWFELLWYPIFIWADFCVYF